MRRRSYSRQRVCCLRAPRPMHRWRRVRCKSSRNASNCGRGHRTASSDSELRFLPSLPQSPLPLALDARSIATIARVIQSQPCIRVYPYAERRGELRATLFSLLAVSFSRETIGGQESCCDVATLKIFFKKLNDITAGLL